MAVIRTERSRHSMLRKMGLNRERLLLAYFIQGTKRNKSLIREFAEVWSFPVYNVWGAVYQLQMLAIPSWLHDGLFIALRELLEMLHTLSGNLKFVCQQFLYPTRLRDSVTKCLPRCFRDYEFKFCLSVSFFQASFTPFFVSRLRRRLSVHSFTHRIHFWSLSQVKKYEVLCSSFHRHKEDSKWPFLSGFIA